MTKRQQVVDSFKDNLKSLQQVDPFWQKVTFLEWENTLDTTTLPAIIIFDKEDEILKQSIEHKHSLNIEIELHTSGDDAKPEFMRERLAEILRAFKDYKDCNNLELNATNIDIDNAEERVAIAQIKLTVDYYNGYWEM